MLEFHVDDTAADEREDALVEVAFHVPSGQGPPSTPCFHSAFNPQVVGTVLDHHTIGPPT